MGSSIAFSISTIGLALSMTNFPVLIPPLLATSLYAGQKVLNNTLYKSFKDLAFIAKRKGNNTKIYQDVLRPDIFRMVRGLDTREKLGFLQLQALVGMAKFDANDKNGNPLTLETDSHGIIRNTFQKLNELGYIQNYNETHLRDGRLTFPKLAFGNTDISKRIPIYNMTFQRTSKIIDFDDPEFRRMFPMIFSQRGLLAKQGYTIEIGKDGRPSINYGDKKRKKKLKEKQIQTKSLNEKNIREEVRVNISQKQQKRTVQKFLQQENKDKQQEQEEKRTI